MKKIIAALVFMLISVAAHCQTSATTFPESGFSANFPKAPTVQKQTFTSPMGEIPMTLYLCDAGDYMVMVSENSFSAEAAANLKKTGATALLKGSKDGALKNVAQQLGGTFKSTEEENYLFNNKYSALKVSGKIDEVDVKANYILKDNRLYQILVIGDISSAPAANFIASFKLID